MAEYKYGYQIMRPVALVQLVPAPPETPAERFARQSKAIGWASVCILGGVAASAAWAALTTLAQAPSLSVVGGIVIGAAAFTIWSGR